MKFQQFQIPKKFFDKLYEFTGSEESSRGFICAYLKQDGDPVVFFVPTQDVFIEFFS